MRLWSVHPEYLDARGLVALWREGLLARRVLHGLTKGYRRHPQLDRFKKHANPLAAIDCYLWYVYREATGRGYGFDVGKLGAPTSCTQIEVAAGQLKYELEHLRQKLKLRDGVCFRNLERVTEPRPHPLFRMVAGGIEPWERVAECNLRR